MELAEWWALKSVDTLFMFYNVEEGTGVTVIQIL